MPSALGILAATRFVPLNDLSTIRCGHAAMFRWTGFGKTGVTANNLICEQHYPGWTLTKQQKRQNQWYFG
jgi:hypothetical protein